MRKAASSTFCARWPGRVPPRVIHFEHWALPAKERGELLGLLGERGYRMRMSEVDVLAVDAGLQATIDDGLGWPC
jgi:hypothetical protein